MGNYESHDFLPVWEPEQKILDLNRAVDHKDFNRHIKGITKEENSLTELPNNILEEISLYETLLAKFNSFTEIPAVLPLHLPHLSYLDLSYNKLIRLPDSFGLFFHLREIFLNNNRLENLPQGFTTLRKLERVDLSVNKLLSLPEDLGNLQELTKINLNHNRLTYLPKSFSKCKKLKIILARNNYCQNPPQEVCDKGSEDLLNYIQSTYGEKLEKKLEHSENIFPRVYSNQIESPIVKSARVQYMQIQTQTANTPNPCKTPLALPYNATSYLMEELKDKIVGLIYGAAIGDALGLATDFLTPDECRFYYDKLIYSQIITDGHRSHWNKGSWTSNTDHMLIILDSIIQWAGVIDELDFAQKLSNWKHKGNYSVSVVINDIISIPDFINNPHVVAKELLLSHCNGFHEDQGEGQKNHLYVDDASLPSAVILGILHFYNLREVISNTVRICSATHADPQCMATNVTISCIVASLLQAKYDITQDANVNAIVESCKLLAEDYLKDVDYKNQYYNCFNHQTLESAFSTTQSTHPFSVLSVVITSLRTPRDFRSSLHEILMHGGHASMNGCIIGALLGCMTGYKNLPKDLIQELNQAAKEELNNKINTFLDMMALP